MNLDSIEVEYVGSRTCFIVDPRIPREWLRSDFCTGCVPEKIQELCRGKYASMFREKSLGE